MNEGEDKGKMIEEKKSETKPEKEPEKIPTLAELAERKKVRDIEHDAQTVLGSDIEIVEEEKPTEDEKPVVEPVKTQEILGDEIEIIEADEEGEGL